MKNVLAILWGLVLIVGIFLQDSQAEVIRYVTVAGAGAKNGTSWDNAYDSTQLQTAINESGVTEVWVAKGTYKRNWAGSRGDYLDMKNDCAIYGGFAGTETSIGQRTNFGLNEINETILSGDIGTIGSMTDNYYHVIRGGYYTTSSAILDGFTIRDGYADGFDAGGMLINEGSDPTIRNCTFVNNYASGNGGGLASGQNCHATIINCKFFDNHADQNGGGVSFYGNNSSLTNCTFSNNSAGQHGGGVYGTYYCNISLTNCLLTGNSATQNGGGVYLAGYLYNYLTNCTVSNNTAANGGGVFNASSGFTIRNSIIWGNDASSNGDELYLNNTTSAYYSCYANESGDIYGSLSADEHCITSNPQFATASSYPYHIYGTSPCVDAGYNDYNSQDYDIRGSGYHRKLNKDTGGTGVIDMGAYEYKYAVDYYNSEGSLPVELTDFSAKSVSGGVLLTWTTESEVENLGFIIENRRRETGDWNQVVSYLTDKALVGHGSTTAKHEYQYTDTQVQPGVTYFYRLADVDYSGKMMWHKEVEVKAESEGEKIPLEFGLQPAYPNPFNPSVTLNYSLTDDGLASLKVYNLRGELVKVLMSTYVLKGTYSYTWQPLNLESGMYILCLQSGRQTNYQKIVSIK